MRVKTSNIIAYAVLAVLAVIWILPLAWLVLNSLRGEGGAYTTYIMPKTFTLKNYTTLFTDTKLFNYPRWFMNTLIVAVFSCALSTFYVLSTSYVFSRLRFRSRTALMNVALVLGMFPGFMSMTAVYHIVNAIGLSQQLAALILIYSGGAALTYYIAKGFFDTVPTTLDEAALVDGATKSQIFWRVILPLSRQVIIYTVMTSFIAPWMDFIFASVIMRDKYDSYTIAVGLFRMVERENIRIWFTRFCAGAVIIAVPISILFFIMQRYYVGGVTSGAVKG
jgi:arabinogalactan oligomer/maltooligosaccharide transport system permease protein